MQTVGTFGELLRRHRIALGISQADLARKARVSVESISALERGVRRAPYGPTVAQLSAALSLSSGDCAAFEWAAANARARDGQRRRGDRAGTAATNLPAAQSSFVGRQRDIAHLVRLLERHRFVTITGAGGVGKTRAAAEAGRVMLAERAMEVWFVDLAALGDGSFIADRIASSLRPPLAGRFEHLDSLTAALAAQRALLILDNCEHLIEDVAAVVHHLLAHCPEITVLATSRERLNILGETVYRLPSLSFPSHWPRGLDEARTYGALALFIDRAEAMGANVSGADPSLENVVDICRRLDGIPLAIEIAAGRLPSLGLAALSERLAESFTTAAGDGAQPTRQQTMLATLTWSHGLLNAAEQVLLRRLAIFSGGFTLAAAESVSSEAPLHADAIAEILASLVDKSLVAAVHGEAGTRYRLLESLRAFSLAKLEEAGEKPTIARNHARWVGALADSVRPSGLAEIPKAAAVAPELDNARAALAWCKTAELADDRALAAKIVVGLQGLWALSGRHTEHEQVARDALETLDAEAYPLDAALLSGKIVARSWPGPSGARDIERAMQLFERLGRPDILAQSYAMFTMVYAMIGEPEKAESAAARALQFVREEHLEHTLTYADFLVKRSKLRAVQRRFDEARADLTEASALAAALGSDFYVVAMCLPCLAEVELKAGNLQLSLALTEKMLASDVPPVQEMVTLEALGFLASLKLRLGDTDAAEDAARRQLELGRGDETMAIEYLATIAARRGQAEKAARLAGFVDRLLADVPLLGFSYQRTDDLLAASLREQLAPAEIAAHRAAGAAYSLTRATAEALHLER